MRVAPPATSARRVGEMERVGQGVERGETALWVVPEVEQDYLVRAVAVGQCENLLAAFIGAAGDDDSHVAGEPGLDQGALSGDRAIAIAADAACRDRKAPRPDQRLVAEKPSHPGIAAAAAVEQRIGEQRAVRRREPGAAGAGAHDPKRRRGGEARRDSARETVS